MLRFIITITVSVWTTSTLFMLFFWANTFITILRRDGKIFIMPLSHFLYFHFCPIVHTIQCFKIMRRAMELYEEKRRV